MALLWADFPSGSQGLYGNQASRMLNGTPWVSIMSSSLDTDPDPLVGSAGRVFRPQNNLVGNIFQSMPTLALPAIEAGAGVSFRFWVNSFNASEAVPIAMLTSASNENGYFVQLEVNGALTLRRRTGSGGSTTTLVSTDTPAITTNAWWHLSFKADATTGDVSLQRNGDTILSTTDPSPVPGGTLGLAKFGRRGFISEAIGAYIKDLMVWNTEGSQNNDHPGNVSVFYRPVNGDITLGGWVPSTGAEGYPLIGNEGPPDDGTYLSADDTPPAFMEYDLEDLPEDITSVRGVISVVRAAKIDGGDGNLQVSLSPDGVTYADGADRPITTAFTYWSDVNELNPDTGSPYLPVEFNGTRIKINRTL